MSWCRQTGLTCIASRSCYTTDGYSSCLFRTWLSVSFARRYVSSFNFSGFPSSFGSLLRRCVICSATLGSSCMSPSRKSCRCSDWTLATKSFCNGSFAPNYRVAKGHSRCILCVSVLPLGRVSPRKSGCQCGGFYRSFTVVHSIFTVSPFISCRFCSFLASRYSGNVSTTFSFLRAIGLHATGLWRSLSWRGTVPTPPLSLVFVLLVRLLLIAFHFLLALFVLLLSVLALVR